MPNIVWARTSILDEIRTWEFDRINPFSIIYYPGRSRTPPDAGNEVIIEILLTYSKSRLFYFDQEAEKQKLNSYFNQGSVWASSWAPPTWTMRLLNFLSGPAWGPAARWTSGPASGQTSNQTSGRLARSPAGDGTTVPRYPHRGYKRGCIQY